MSGSELYRRHSLMPHSKCIRVLDVLAVSDAEEDLGLIRCNVRILGLGENLPYTALSYVWGIDTLPSPYYIVCDGTQEIQVTANCYSALLHLRRRLGSFTIWVDAVCINQNDLAEKSQQIPLMTDIYKDAGMVYVWLGHGTLQTKRAMKFLTNSDLLTGDQQPRPRALAASLYFSQFGLTRYPIPMTEKMAKRPWHKAQDHVRHRDLKDLFTRPWINRVWKFQEILLAFNAEVVCGNEHVPWSNFERGIVLARNLGNLDFISPLWSSLIQDRNPAIYHALAKYQSFLDQVARILRWMRYTVSSASAG